MKNLKYPIFLFLLIGLCSCSAFLGFILGVHPEKHESKKEQVKYLRRYHLDTSNLLVIKKLYTDSLKKYDISPTAAQKSGGICAVQFRMFDHSGQFLSGWGICLGPADYNHLYDTFPPVRLKWVDGALNLKQDLKMYTTLDGKDVSVEQVLGNHHYVIIAYWAKFLGIPSRTMLKKLEAYIKKNKDRDIVLYKANLGDLKGVE